MHRDDRLYWIRISELEFFTVESVRRDYIEIVNKGKYRRIFLPKVLRQKLILFARKHGVQFYKELTFGNGLNLHIFEKII